MKAAINKPSVRILAVLFAALVALIAGCGPGTTPVAAPPETGTAVRLVFTTQPGGAAAGSVLGPQPVVAAEDAGGNIVTGYRGLAVLTITDGTGAAGARLYGGTRVGFTNGMVEFNSISIYSAGSGYTLTASSGTLEPAVSAPFAIVPGAAAKLEFSVQPYQGVGGSPLTTQPEVTVQDLYGNTVSGYDGSVTLAITSGSGPKAAVLSNTITVPVVNSVARFTDISIDIAYPGYTLTAMSDSLESATSDPFIIAPGAPVKLEFGVQPSGARAGTPFETPPKVVVTDIFGNVVISSRASITLSITPGTGIDGAILSGTKTRVAENAMGGLAEFTGISIDQAGSGYTLTATSDGLTSAMSQAFDVAAP